MRAYLEIVDRVLREGVEKENRTGVPARTIVGAMFTHDMAEGFPLLTTKQIPFRIVATELECFIRGITDKAWLQERKNHIWDEWANPQEAPYGHDTASKERMRRERDLGPIYGFQWRHFGAEYVGHDRDYAGQGIDQLAAIVETLKRNPHDRRMIVSAWNPVALPKMGLPPCHYAFQVTVVDRKVNLLWNQRSVDTMLGLPFNIANYGLLLHLLARETNLEEGKLVGFLADVHIYANHIDGAREQLSRDPLRYPPPRIATPRWTSIFEWSASDTEIIDYQCYPRIPLAVAV